MQYTKLGHTGVTVSRICASSMAAWQFAKAFYTAESRN